MSKLRKDEEDQAILAEFREFDRKIIHEKYKSVVEKLQTPQQVPPAGPGNA